mgnify:FL=1
MLNLNMKKKCLTLVKLSISLGGLIYIFYNVPIKAVSSHWSYQALPWIILILICVSFNMIVQANRWKKLLLEDGKKIKLKTFYAYIALGYFFSNLLPSRLGGDAVKTIAFGKKYGNMANSVAAILISRVMGLLAMFLFFFVMLPFVMLDYSIPHFYIWVVGGVSIVSIVVIVLGLFLDKVKFPTKLSEKLSFFLKLQDAMSIYRSHPKEFWLSVVDSIWLQISSIIIHYAYFQAVGITIDFAIITIFMTITITLSMLPISINGIGLREGVNVSLFSGLLGIPPDVVLAASLIGYIPMLFQSLQGAIFFFGGNTTK